MSNVTINAATLENFNGDAGQDVSLTVSVTTSSQVVTIPFGAELPASLLGVAGAVITIAGVNYTIAGVTSRTSFTLTANYTGATNTAVAAILRKFVQLRFYASAPFVPLGDNDPVQADQVGTAGFFKLVACSVTNDGAQNVLQLPQITLPATLDGSPGNATYAAVFYDAAGTRQVAEYDGFRAFSLSASTPVTWAQVFAANNPGPALNLPGSGIFVQTSSLNFALRTLQPPAAGIAITNPAGTAGDPTLVLANDLAALEGLSSAGIAARTAADTWTTRTVTGTANRIGVTNGDGVAGNPTLDIGSDVVTLTGSQTLTNKNLTSPTITGTVSGSPTIASTAIIKGYARNLTVNTSPIGNVGGGVDELHSFSLPAGSLQANGDYVNALYAGRFSTTADKRIIISFGGQTVSDSGVFDIDAAEWSYRICYTRLSSTSVLCVVQALWGFINRTAAGVTAGNANVFTAVPVPITVTDLASNAMTMLVQGAATADNDIVQNLSIIELVQR